MKLGKKNYLFDFFLKKGIAPHLIIGHGPWKVDEFDNKEYLTGERFKEDDIKFMKRVARQIQDFMDSRNDRENTYFWVFHEEKIFVLQAISKIFDLCNYDDPHFKSFCNEIEKWKGDKNINKKDADKFNLWSDAKLCKARFVKGFEKGINSNEIIHKFASINAHQGYNRRTIAEIKGDESTIANAILDSVIEEKSLTTPKNIKEKIGYLSPLQLETLVFLSIYEMGFLPACYRGGTGKDYDILLNNSNCYDYHSQNDRLKGVNYISVKLKENQVIEILKNQNYNLDKNIFYIFADYSDPKSRREYEKAMSVEDLMGYLDKSQIERIEKWINAQINLIPFNFNQSQRRSNKENEIFNFSEPF